MPQLSDFKALLFDVDKTLTDSSRTIRPRTRQAVNKVVEAGFISGFCTGKNWGKILHENLENLFPATSLHVLTGGAQVVSGTGEVKWEEYIDADSVHKITQLAQQHQVDFFIRHTLHLYGTPHILAYHQKKSSDPHQVIRPLNPEVLNQSTPSMGVLNPPPAFIAAVKAVPTVILKENIVQNSTYGDITKVGITKGEGVKQWCQLQGITPKQVIGFGDSNNDHEFLQTVGWAVALGNATPAVKALADRVIGHTDDDGLAVYLEQILASNQL